MEAETKSSPEAEPTPVSPEPAEAAAEAQPEPAPEPAKTAEESLLEQLDAAQTEAKSWQERYLRGVAELENYRKRALREKDEARRFASMGLIEDLLPILDNFAMGLKAAEANEATQAFAQGFEMILGQLQQTLEQNGVKTLEPVGDAFDPHQHESVAHQPDETVPEGHIISVQRTGYQLHDRLVRAASVVVSSGPASGETTAAEKPTEA